MNEEHTHRHTRTTGTNQPGECNFFHFVRQDRKKKKYFRRVEINKLKLKIKIKVSIKVLRLFLMSTLLEIEHGKPLKNLSCKDCCVIII